MTSSFEIVLDNVPKFLKGDFTTGVTAMVAGPLAHDCAMALPEGMRAAAMAGMTSTGLIMKDEKPNGASSSEPDEPSACELVVAKTATVFNRSAVANASEVRRKGIERAFADKLKKRSKTKVAYEAALVPAQADVTTATAVLQRKKGTVTSAELTLGTKIAALQMARNGLNETLEAASSVDEAAFKARDAGREKSDFNLEVTLNQTNVELAEAIEAAKEDLRTHHGRCGATYNATMTLAEGDEKTLDAMAKMIDSIKEKCDLFESAKEMDKNEDPAAKKAKDAAVKAAGEAEDVAKKEQSEAPSTNATTTAAVAKVDVDKSAAAAELKTEKVESDSSSVDDKKNMKMAKASAILKSKLRGEARGIEIAESNGELTKLEAEVVVAKEKATAEKKAEEANIETLEAEVTEEKKKEAAKKEFDAAAAKRHADAAVATVKAAEAAQHLKNQHHTKKLRQLKQMKQLKQLKELKELEEQKTQATAKVAADAEDAQGSAVQEANKQQDGARENFFMELGAHARRLSPAVAASATAAVATTPASPCPKSLEESRGIIVSTRSEAGKSRSECQLNANDAFSGASKDANEAHAAAIAQAKEAADAEDVRLEAVYNKVIAAQNSLRVAAADAVADAETALIGAQEAKLHADSNATVATVRLNGTQIEYATVESEANGARKEANIRHWKAFDSLEAAIKASYDAHCSSAEEEAAKMTSAGLEECTKQEVALEKAQKDMLMVERMKNQIENARKGSIKAGPATVTSVGMTSEESPSPSPSPAASGSGADIALAPASCTDIGPGATAPLFRYSYTCKTMKLSKCSGYDKNGAVAQRDCCKCGGGRGSASTGGGLRFQSVAAWSMQRKRDELSVAHLDRIVEEELTEGSIGLGARRHAAASGAGSKDATARMRSEVEDAMTASTREVDEAEATVPSARGEERVVFRSPVPQEAFADSARFKAVGGAVGKETVMGHLRDPKDQISISKLVSQLGVETGV